MTWLTYALLTALLNSLASLYEKHTLNKLHSIDFSAAIAFTTALLTLPVLWTASWDNMTPGILAFMFILSVIAATAFLSVIRAMRHMEISLSSPMFLLGPLITTLFAFLILGERVSQLQILGITILVFGTYMLETERLSHGKEFIINIWQNKYSRFILFGLLLYGLSSVGDRIVLGKWGISPVLYTAIVQIFIAIQFSFLTWHHRGSPLASIKLVRHYWKAILIIALLTIGYRITQGYATAIAAVGLVIAIKRSSSLFTTIIGGELFHDHGVWRKTSACVIMIIGVYLIAAK